MKKRFYAVVPALLLLLVLAVFIGVRWNGKHSDSGSDEYSISIIDDASSKTDSSASLTGSVIETGSTQTTASVSKQTKAETSASLTEATEQTARTKSSGTTAGTAATTTRSAVIDQNGTYTSKDDVALYIHTYGTLPSNFITKKQAQALGWSGGSLEPYAPGKSIGGSVFGNYEGNLPAKKGRQYTECDIDTQGKSSRGAKRIVFSNDGLIYYTGDHYKTFELLYGEE